MNGDNEENLSNFKNPETDYIIDPVTEDNESLQYGLYSQLTTLATFYSYLQSKFRNVAIRWLVAALIGISYLLSLHGREMPIKPLIGVLLLEIIGVWGILILWYLDIFIYQTHYYGIIVELAKMEKRNTWLPRTNIHIVYFQAINRKHAVYQSYFYSGCIIILLSLMCITAIALSHFLFKFIFLWTGIFLISCVILISIMRKIELPRKSPVLEEFVSKKEKSSS